jgi:hypothetical protein
VGKYTRLHRLPAQHYEAFRSLHHEPRKLVAQNAFNLIRLLYLDAKADGVDGGFN